jgi:hypothetical protein
VKKIETITAAHYHIKSSAIYNPDAKGIKSVLLIPTIVSKKQEWHQILPLPILKKHTVLPKETLYGIAKQLELPLKI